MLAVQLGSKSEVKHLVTIQMGYIWRPSYFLYTDCIILSILFDMFIKCGYVPLAFCESAVVPLVKCKTCDLTAVNNYRVIALSNAITKILKHILCNFYFYMPMKMMQIFINLVSRKVTQLLTVHLCSKIPLIIIGAMVVMFLHVS